MRKGIIIWIAGAFCFYCFLAICSEPAPGEDPGISEFLMPKLAAFLGLLSGALVIRKVDKKQKSKK